MSSLDGNPEPTTSMSRETYSLTKEQIVARESDISPRASSISLSLTREEEKKLLRRIDWHMLPLLAIIYTVKSVDASNVSNARIMDQGTPNNILNELGMSSNEYNFVTLAYYLPYIVAETPSNLVLKYFKPSVWQARITISWGIVLCCHAAVTNSQGLFAVRFFLGLCEAGLWPGIMAHLCYWYRPDEITPRIVLVTILGNFSSVISGVLAFAFTGVEARGLSGWKWLVLTEGLFTIFLGVLVYLFVPDFPTTASWLTGLERAFVQARLPATSPKASDKNFDFREFIDTLKDKRVWLFLLCWAFFNLGTTGLNFYQSTVIANLGFTSIAQAQLLNIPPAVFCLILTVLFGIIGDTGHIPQPAIPIFFMISIQAVYAVLYTFPNVGGEYAALVLAGGLSNAWYTMMWPWRVQTTQGTTGSAFAIAFANSYGQIGSAVGSQLFNSKYAPHYTVSFAIAMGFIGLSIIMGIVTWCFTWREDVEIRKIKRTRKTAAKNNGPVEVNAGERLGDIVV